MSIVQGLARGLVIQVRNKKPTVTAPSSEWEQFVGWLETRRDTVVARLRSRGVRNVEKAKLLADLKVINTELLVALAHVDVNQRIGR